LHTVAAALVATSGAVSANFLALDKRMLVKDVRGRSAPAADCDGGRSDSTVCCAVWLVFATGALAWPAGAGLEARRAFADAPLDVRVMDVMGSSSGFHEIERRAMVLRAAQSQ
jgi:hypothetical protein